LFREILSARDCEIEEIEIAVKNVHIYVSIHPKYSVGKIVRIVKKIFMRQPVVKGELWEDRYFVRTIGTKITSEVIKK